MTPVSGRPAAAICRTGPLSWSARPSGNVFIRDYYWNTWQTLMGERGIPDDMPPAQQRMLNAAAHLAAHLDEAPVLLLACAKTEYPPLAAMQNERANAAVIHGTIYPAVQNILLACRALGVGATLTTIHCFFEEELKTAFRYPGGHGSLGADSHGLSAGQIRAGLTCAGRRRHPLGRLGEQADGMRRGGAYGSCRKQTS